ncbi:hypothetical protein Cme02nite_38400 [Catellatospora methionotrophica]|uniref:Uncharacterized protein n=1 Tax=Catellatospora methionotrophica TaxID=121620 RepID=A0A8J3LC95_9ACTN|nr:hypothetical protein [Catellatospora methionotrophica]GIG15508.1 hypothetical protein Cme02nite_38400 [Catellatospora methionotrophica]
MPQPAAITDEQLEAVARQDIRAAIDNLCTEASSQSEVLYEEFPEACNDDDEDGWEQLIKRYDAIVRRVRDEHFPAS